MITPQTYPAVEAAQLVPAVEKMKQDGWRLVQIGATRLPDDVELTYSFGRDLELANLRLLVPAAGARVPSISSVFWCAFIYENEIHDLFNVQFDGMAVDFHGNFYKTTVPFPFGVPPRIKPAASRPAAATVAPTSGVSQPPAGSARPVA